MGYETKVILITLAELVKNSADVKEAYGHIVRAANAEGIVIDPHEDNKKNG